MKKIALILCLVLVASFVLSGCNNLSTITYEQVLSIFNSYLLFNGRK